MKLNFYELLTKDQNFCSALGKTVLAAGRLESTLKSYLLSKTHKKKHFNAPLSQLIKLAEQHGLPAQIVIILNNLRSQRNYLAHNIYPLMAGLIDETFLERDSLVDEDISLFEERATQLAADLNYLSQLIEKHTVI